MIYEHTSEAYKPFVPEARTDDEVARCAVLAGANAAICHAILEGRAFNYINDERSSGARQAAMA